MAEGGQGHRSFRESFSKASGDADEAFCDPCRSVGKHIAVEGFCQICEEHLCDNCLEVHRKQKITRAHVILDKNKMPSGQVSMDNQDVCVEVCKKHRPEIVRFFCKVHNEPGCVDCMALNHSTCKKYRVQDISGSFKESKEFEDIDQHLEQFLHDVDNLDRELNNNLQNLDETFNHVLQKIASARKQVNAYLDQVQKKITDKAEQMKRKDEAELKTFLAENQAMKTETEEMIEMLHKADVNVNSLFVISKHARHRLVTMEEDISNIKKRHQPQYEFHISSEIENIVSAKTPLGKLSRRSSQESREMAEKVDQRTPTVDSTAVYNRSINVKSETDKVTCDIVDCTLLNANRMVVTDFDNKNVKLIDITNNTVISSYNTPCAPSKVTLIDANTIAVSLPDLGKIQVLNVTSTFTLQREIKVNKGCYGLAYKDGKFAVSYVDPGKVDILDIKGKILHKIQGKQHALKWPHYLIFGHEQNTMIVSDCHTDSIIVVTFSGQILHTYTHDRLNYSCGVVMTGEGVLFACSESGGCIHVVSPDFKSSKLIINKGNHIVLPLSITYCGSNHRLYISNTRRVGDLATYIQVYDLK